MNSITTRRWKSIGNYLPPTRHGSRLLFILPLLIALLSLYPTTGLAQTCTDSDGDTYAIEGGTCGEVDCDDDNPAVNPGASELCNAIDDDCDAEIDEDFDVGAECILCEEGVDDECEGKGICVTGSHRICTVDGLDTYCPLPEGGLIEPVPETPYTISCHDNADNDCDGASDGDDTDCPATEQCNGWDDDYDGETDEGFTYNGIAIGNPCTAGTGACERSGKVICNETEDGGECSAIPASPKDENTPGTGNCIDGEDNDCDGLTDIADTGCQEPEKCDGVDNDGDGLVDEDFVSDPHNLGQPCSEGVGACAASGVYICSSDKTTTVCSAAGQLAGTEGPTGETCSDGIDNDCNGLIDEADPNCGSVNLTALCALPYLRGKPGSDCNGWHEIQFGAENMSANATISAELLAVDLDGNIIDSTPVENGDAAHLASRIDPNDYKFMTKKNKKGTRHQVFAPVPLLHVMVEDGLNISEAYCSNIPYIEVAEPSGAVTSSAEVDTIPVRVAIPLVDISTISVKVDGVYILSELGINPDDCTPSNPCSGTITDGPLAGAEISDLRISGSPINTLGVNTLLMKLSNLGCGGHVVVVEGDQLPGSFPMHATPQCNEDDLKDSGTAGGFSIEIDEPQEGSVTSEVPTPVRGSVCSGRPIASVRINGKILDIEGEVEFTPGDGEDSGDLYEYQIDTTLPQTDLASELSTGQAQIGTFDAGSNRLIAESTDDLGNRVFKTLIFAVGDVAKPGVNPLAAAFQAELPSMVESLASKEVQAAIESSTTEVENAFVVGITEPAIQKVFNARVTEAADEFLSNVRNNLYSTVINKSLSHPCSCDPPVVMWFSNVETTSDASCQVDFVQDQINVAVTLPNLQVTAKAYGYCKDSTDFGLFTVCWSETIVSMTTTVEVQDITLSFSITEGQLMGEQGADASNFNIGATTDVDTSAGVDVNCLASVCDWFVSGLFGIDLSPNMDISKETVFNKALGSSEPDPIKLAEIKVDEEEVENFGQVMRGDLVKADITPDGLRATLKGKFSTLSVDPEIEETPGAALTPAQPPLIHPSAAGEVYLALADDTFNQLFAGLTASGALKTNCQATSLTFSDLWPGDCEALGMEDKPLVTALWQGTCHGYTGDDCNSIPVPADQPLIAQAEKNACNNAQDKLSALNISEATPLFLCVKQDNPPTFLIKDDSATNPVETVLRLNDLSVAIVLDRNLNGFDGTQLTSIPKCLDPSAETQTEGDCLGFSMCLDLDLLNEMQFQTCEDGKPGFVTRFKNIFITDQVAGVPCGGLPPVDDDLMAEISADSDPVSIDLTGNMEDFTPPVCAKGLDLGGFVQGLKTGSLKLISIDADQGLDDPFQDYLGITGDVEP